MSLIPIERRVNSLLDYFDNFERTFFDAPSQHGIKTDVEDTGESFLIICELPGFDKSDIKVDIEGDRLTISAERKYENEEKDKNYLYRERGYGKFSRSFDTSASDAENIKASYKDGVLKLDLPKRKPEVIDKSRKVEIE